MINIDDLKDLDEKGVIDILNYLQENKFIRIISYEGLTIKLRPQLDKLVQPDVSEWIDEWSKLWHGIKSGSYYVAQPPKSNAERMIKFIKEFGFTKEIIFEATKKYISDKASTGYAYMKKSTKFIIDTEGSELYSCCEAVRTGDISVDFGLDA